MKLIAPVVMTDAMLVSSTVPEADYPVWSASLVYGVGTRVIVLATHKIYESLQGTASIPVAISIASPAVVTWNNHGRTDGTPISFTTTGLLPTGLTVGTVYYVLAPTTNSFNVAATVGGAAINTSGSQSGVHNAVSSPNYNASPPSNVAATSSTPTTPLWLEISSTNRWKMFDSTITSQATAVGSMTYIVKPGRINSLAFMNVSCDQISISMVETLGGAPVYSKVIDMQGEIQPNWYSYAYSPITRQTDVVLTDLPLVGTGIIAITLSNGLNTGNVACGTMVSGNFTELGSTASSPTISIRDYSRKETDVFGNQIIVVRPYSKRMDAKVKMDTADVDMVANLLAQYRATPVVWVGADNIIKAMIIYGYYRDFSIDIAYPNISFCSLSIEGMI